MERSFIERSRSGLPCVWEEGGGFKNTGKATLVADYDGRQKTPIYINRNADINGKHALIPINVGDIIICTDRYRDLLEIVIYSIGSIVTSDNYAELNFIIRFNSRDFGDSLFYKKYKDVIDAAVEKTYCIECKKPHFIKPRKNNKHKID